MKPARTKEIKFGMTLVESVTYIGIFGIVFLSIIQFVLAINTYNLSAAQKGELERSKIYLLEHLQDSFRKSTSVDTVNSTFANNAGKLRLLPSSGYYEYYLNGTVLTFSQSGSTFPLTPSNVQVTKLYFEKVNTVSGTTIGTRITIDLKSTKSSNATSTIQTMYSVR